MYYYSATFCYPGPYCGAAGPDEKTDEALDIADRTVMGVLLLNIESRLQYYWPDGSLHRYIKSDLPYDDLLTLIKGRSQDKVHIQELTEILGTDTDINKTKVEELFNLPD